MTLNLPDVGMTEAELKKELAAMLFKKNKLPLDKAAELAGESASDFQQRLGIRPAPRISRRASSTEYSLADFEADISTLKALGRL